MLKKSIQITKPMNIEVIVTSKKMKSMILKYKEGKFHLSKPTFVSESKAKEWLESLSLSQYQHLMKQNKVKFTNEFIYIFGKKYSIHLHDVNENRVVFRNQQIYVYKKDYLKRYLRQMLKDYCEKRIKEFHLVDFDVEVEVQEMSSKWGCCFYKQKKIKFASKLIHEPKEIIDGIILHELVHFYHPNHQKEFYEMLKKYNPHYRLHNAFLKSGGVGDDPIGE